MKIARDSLVDRLCQERNTEDRKRIKLITGIRGSGKSSLMDMLADRFAGQGMEKDQIINLNFADLRYEDICRENILYDFLSKTLSTGLHLVIILQEVRYTENIEKTIDSLSVYDNADIYITTSETYLEEEELDHMLFGKYVRINVLPLSFSEFAAYARLTDLLGKGPENHAPDRLYAAYLREGGFPYILYSLAENAACKPEKAPLGHLTPAALGSRYVQSLYDAILIHDIVPHRQISDTPILEYLFYFLCRHIGQTLSPKKISDTLRLAGRPTNTRTVDSYIQAFEQTCLVYRIKRYDLAKDMPLKTLEKYYIADLAFRTCIFHLENDPSSPALLENLICLQLIRGGWKVYNGKLGTGQITFTALRKDPKTGREERCYIQVSGTSSIFEQETESPVSEGGSEEQKKTGSPSPALATNIRSFIALYKKIKDNYPKYIVSFDPKEYDLSGIKCIPALKFLERS